MKVLRSSPFRLFCVASALHEVIRSYCGVSAWAEAVSTMTVMARKKRVLFMTISLVVLDEVRGIVTGFYARDNGG